MCFKADAFHHQHTVTQQALDALLVQLLEEVAAVRGDRVHARPLRGPVAKNVDRTVTLSDTTGNRTASTPTACWVVHGRDSLARQFKRQVNEQT